MTDIALLFAAIEQAKREAGKRDDEYSRDDVAHYLAHREATYVTSRRHPHWS